MMTGGGCIDFGSGVHWVVRRQSLLPTLCLHLELDPDIYLGPQGVQALAGNENQPRCCRTEWILRIQSLEILTNRLAANRFNHLMSTTGFKMLTAHDQVGRIVSEGLQFLNEVSCYRFIRIFPQNLSH
jgi:hypothetical protein